MYTGKYYYNQKHFKLIKGDTFRVLKEFNDSSYDVIVVNNTFYQTME